MRIYMQSPITDERPPRFYQLFLHEDLLEGWTLVREWGYTGGAGRSAREHFVTREAAEQALARHRDVQLGKGFKVMFMQGQEQPR